MLTLCLDTSHIFLTVCLIRDNEIIYKYQEECWKRQSEEIFPVLLKAFDDLSLQPEDIDNMVITEGPGSYTGIRIAMTIAKVICSMKNIPLFTLDTLLLYAGKKNCRVLLDARGGRVYTAVFENGLYTEDASASELKELEINEEELVGDLHLIDREDYYPDLCENFLILKDLWKKSPDVNLVVPNYLKSIDSYRKTNDQGN